MRLFAANLLTATAYVALGWLGLYAMPPHPVVSGVWPAAGLAVALLYIEGRRLWPGVLIGAFTINAIKGVPLPAAGLIAIGNTAGPAVGAWLLVRADMSPALSRLRDVGALTLAASGPTAVSAMVGVGALWLVGLVPTDETLPLAGVWWSGDALGVLLVAPMLLVVSTRRMWSSRELAAEAIVLLATLATLTLALFSSRLPYVYMVFPLTAIIAFRLGTSGAVVATLIVAGIAAAKTAAGSGPFTTFAAIHNLLLLQLFLGLLALKGLLLSAATAEREVDAESRTAVRDALAENRDRLAELSRRLFNAHEAERRVIARGLHDDVGQSLTAVKMGLEGLRGHVNESGRSALQEQVGHLDTVLRTVRDLSFELHPAILDDLGLASALRQHVDRLSRRAGFSARVDVALGDLRLPHQVEAACFRLVQEALNNVVRHAAARSVTVTVHEDPEGVDVMVRDDGVGFDPQRLKLRGPTGLGLVGMHERAALVGGIVDVHSTPGQGTSVAARFPVPSEGRL